MDLFSFHSQSPLAKKGRFSVSESKWVFKRLVDFLRVDEP